MIPFQNKATSSKSKSSDLTGKEYGRLTVQGLYGRDVKSGRLLWECLCSCGNVTIISGRNLRTGVTNSCGCLRNDAKHSVTHGMTGTIEWDVWSSAKQRCFDQNINNFYRYGGRGITMCFGFRYSFPEFLRLMGKRPSPEMELDRINNDGHYSCGGCWECTEKGWPWNCRWATPKQGARNRSNNHLIEVFGTKMTVAEAAETYDLEYETLLSRINRQKLVPEEAVTKPLR